MYNFWRLLFLRFLLAARLFDVFDDPARELRRGGVAVEGRDLAGGEDDARAALRDLVGERPGEKGAVNFDEDVGDLLLVPAVNNRQLPLVNLLALAQRVLKLHRLEGRRVRRGLDRPRPREHLRLLGGPLLVGFLTPLLLLPLVGDSLLDRLRGPHGDGYVLMLGLRSRLDRGGRHHSRQKNHTDRKSTRLN